MHKLRLAIRYIWAFPATALGLIFALLAWFSGASFVVVTGVVEVGGGGIRRVISRLPRPLRFNAITLGHIVIGTDHDTLAQIRSHEHVHVRQYERWGILFFPLYMASSLFQLFCGRHPYWHNYFERQAYQQEPLSLKKNS